MLESILTIDYNSLLLIFSSGPLKQSEYVDSLVTNIAYSVETSNVILQILKECIIQKKYVNPDKYVEMVEHAQNNIKAAMEKQLVPQYYSMLSKNKNNQQDLSAEAEM